MNFSPSYHWRNNRGRVIAAFAALALLAFTVTWLQRDPSRRPQNLPVTTVQSGPLIISVTESGTVRPRQQIILRNEMDETSTIISIVKEGSLVKKGDLLVELDATMFENERAERWIRVQNSEASLVFAQENFGVVTNQAQADIEQAELQFAFAKQDLEKYLDGEFPKQVKELEARITLAEEELGRAREQVRWSQILFKEKYLSQSDLQQDELAAKKNQLNLDLAREDLTLATNYTHLRQLAQLKSNVRQTEMALERTRRKAAANIAQAEADLRARQVGHREEQARLARVESEISKSRIHAPIDGMVLYASSVSSDWDNDEDRIQEGATVDERGEIIYLPTADAFDVDIRIPEINLTKVTRGLPVRIQVDALPGRPILGRVTSISPLPDAQSRFWNPNLKLYNTVIQVESPDVPLRNGMSCQAEIIVQEFANTLYVPVQSVVGENGRPTVYKVDGDQIEPALVELGLDNNRVVQILGGLKAGDTVLLTPPLQSRPVITVPSSPADESTSATRTQPRDSLPEGGKS